ncbi:MAG: putative O-glycosylation ligase, exosortase A system-associated [Planctomycetes bacterium]|nr:putative O-glycosylation ligase, exosortase A system-associated [Planctomycetota bacterium]
MRDLIVAGFILATLPTCFRRPFIGLLVFTLLAYMRLQDLTWGWARYERWSFYVAVVTAAGFLLGSGQRRFMLPDMRCWIMVLLVVLVGLSLVTSRFFQPSDLGTFTEFCKIIAVALFTTGVVRNREYLRILVYVIALSFGFFGVKNGLAFILSGFRMEIIQGPGGMLTDRNDFSLALCMGMPLLLHLGLSEKRKILRRGLLLSIPLMVLTILSCHSRGAFLAMGAMALAIAWRSRNRIGGFALIALFGAAAWMAAPPTYKERLSTISQYQTEGSARGRIEAWKVAGNMITSKPLLGVGYNKFQQEYPSYDPARGVEADGNPKAEGTRVAHNSYLQIWAECGTPAFLLYMLLIVLTFRDLALVRREAQRRYHSSWILSYANMFEAGMVAFVVGAVFLNRAQFDLFYHFVAIVVVFGRIARQAMAEEPLRASAAGERGALVAVREPGFGPTRAKDGFERDPRHGGFGRRPAPGVA